MNANQLRASILQMAIEGKLVPQLDSEEPAIHILERICKKRKIKLTPINNSLNDHDLPKGWTKCLIGELLELKAGKFIKGSSIACNPSKENSFPCYGGNGIRGFVENFNRDGLYPIIGRQGALCGNLKLANGKFYATEHAVVVDCFDEVDAKWCFYTLTQLNLNKYATATAQPGLAVKTINGLQITVPPLEEQKRIVAKLEQLLPLVDEYGTAYEKLEELNAEFPDKLKASVLQSAIKGQLVPQLDSEHAVEQIGKVPEDVPFEIPEKWTFVKLSNISVKVHYGYTASAADKGNYKLLRITDISSGYVNWDTVPFCHVDEKAISKMKLAQNDLVIARSGASVGTAYLIKELKCDAVFASYLIRVIPKLDLVYPKYLEIFCKSPFYWKQIQKSSTGTAQLNVNAKSLNNLDLPLPPLEEQMRIVAKVEELFALIDAMKK